MFALLCLALRADRRIWVFALLSICAYAICVWASLDLHACRSKGHCLDITYDFGFFRCLAAFFMGGLTWLLGRNARFNSSYLQTASVLGLALVFALVAAYPALAFACPFLFALLVLGISKDEGWLARILNGEFFQLLGQRSYSIYMMHPIILIAISPINKLASSPLKSLLLAPVYCAIVIVVSGWTYRWIEAPFRNYFNLRAKAVQA
ncbi:acyltransferase family protein [Massilia sp. MB5]|uniref:acyltransferase family protein n=1 Tax=Massilia sp. MB5 TaxID=2919578 RepID=UPI0035A394A4